MKWTEATIQKRLREGRGQGSGADYRPWLEVRDISSSGRKHLVGGTRFGRDVHLFSDIEYRLFLLLDWADEVVELYEQYPLDRDLTMSMAKRLGIRHPHYPGTSTPTVMTVDLVVVTNGSRGKAAKAFNAKADAEMHDETSMEKLQLQSSVLELMDIEHHIIFGSMLPRQQVANLDWFRNARTKEGEQERWPNYLAEMTERFELHLEHAQRSAPEMTLAESCMAFDGMHEAEPGTGLRACRVLMGQKLVLFDLSHPNPPQITLGELELRMQVHDSMVRGTTKKRAQ